MAFTKYFICIALLCSARANPLSQTVCETVPNVYPHGPALPLPLPSLGGAGVGTTTVCESSPNVLGLGIGYPYTSLPLPVPGVGSATVCETTPTNALGLGIGYPHPFNYGYLPCPYSYPRYPVPYLGDNLGYYPFNSVPTATTTVCESSPNVVSILPIPNVANVGSTTVCESTPNVLGILPYPNVPVSNVGTTTVCESTPGVLPVNGLPLPYPGLFPGYAPIGMPFL